MDPDTAKLRRGLRDAGLSDQVIQAAWPSWWRDELADHASGRAELRFALARRLGVSPKGLLGERVEFVWNDEAKFKNLSAEDEAHRAVLSSFGVTIGRLAIRATQLSGSLDGLDAFIIREAVLQSQQYVDLGGLLALCWGVGIPVIHLRVFPLEAKSMHAMVVEVDGRHAILLGRDASYPAPIAFTLAHEIGHIVLGHLAGAAALVDLKDPATVTDPDDQEKEADAFALSLLTGRPDPTITTSIHDFNAPTLAQAVLKAGPQHGIDPATLALCLAHRTGVWPRAMSALKFIYGRDGSPIWRDINAKAAVELNWDEIGPDSAEYLRNVMGA